MTYKLMMTASEIAEELRTLDEPNRDIDDRIWRWVNEKKLCAGWQYDIKEAPAYTTSVDAALTLLPVTGEEGHMDERADFILEHVNGGLTIGCRVGSEDPDHTVWGCNDATAVARASLAAHVRFGLN